ncbi:MAG: class I SAM-dependent methyltransferase [Acidobacteria bacterium]|nr:class I SAM-dependent methyltransferase [Acidobacteriota bacterium]
MRLLEVGAGTGELTAFLLRNCGARVPNLCRMLGPSDLAGQANTLVKALEAGIAPICGVDALELANLFDASSLDIVLYSQCYGYGLSRLVHRKSQIDTRFLHAAMHVLRPGGCLVMISRSNLLFYRFMQWAEDQLPCEYTNAVLKKINRLGCGAKDRSLQTTNQFTVVYPAQLAEMCVAEGCWAEVSPIAPPPGLTSSVHNDRFEEQQFEEQRDLHGFNVQIVFTKCVPGVVPVVRYLSEPSPVWDRLADYLPCPAAAPLATAASAAAVPFIGPALPPSTARRPHGGEEGENKRHRTGPGNDPDEDDDE